MDIQQVKKEVLRSVRGKKSQTYVNRKLGFSYNQVSRWESGLIEISWIDFVKICVICRCNLEQALTEVFNFREHPSDYKKLIEFLLDEMKRKDLESQVGFSPYRLRKWFRGQVSPDLSDFLKIFDSISHLLTDFVEALGISEGVPSLHAALALKARQLSLHRELPFIGAFMHAMELSDYAKLSRHKAGVLARLVGIQADQEGLALQRLQEARVIEMKKGKFVSLPLHLDLRGDFASFKSTRQYWLKRSLERVQAMTKSSKENLFGYLVFATSKTAQKEIVEKYLQFLADIRFIVENDHQTPDRLQVLNVQIFDPREEI